MSLETWIAFVIAIVILSLIPGPIVLFLISQSIIKGIKLTLCALSGVLTGLSRKAQGATVY